MGPGLSIVIVNWNTKDLLPQVLGDVFPWKSERELEVIVIDNASEDGSVAAASAAFPEVDFRVQETNLGFAGGVNKGFAAATQPLILLLNTDVRTSSEDIEALCRYADENERVGIVGPRVHNEDSSLQDSYWRFPSLWRLFCSSTYLYKLMPRSQVFNGERYAGVRYEEPTPVDAVSGCVFLLRREVLEKIGGLDEAYFMYFEETDLCYRAQREGWEVHFAPVASFVHFLGGSSRLAKKRNFLEFRRSLVRFHRKHGGLFAALAARALLLVSLMIRVPYWSLRSLLTGEAGRIARSQLGLYCAGIGDLLQPARAGR